MAVGANIETPWTRRKLGEVEFFLGRLQDEQRDPKRVVPAAFGYYLSAFLSAARSTVYVLEREAKTALKANATQKKRAKATYTEWRDLWEAGLLAGDLALWTLLHDQRGDEVHGFGAKTVTESKMVPVPHVPFPGVAYIASWMHWSMPAATGLGVSTGPGEVHRAVDVHHFELAGERREVVTVCEGILRLLQRLLDDFHEAPLAASTT